MSRNTSVTFQNVCVCDYKKRCYQLSLQSNSCTCSYTYWILDSYSKGLFFSFHQSFFICYIFIIFHFNMSRLFSLFHAFNTSIFFTSPSPMVWKSDKMAAKLGMTSVWPCLDWGQKKKSLKQQQQKLSPQRKSCFTIKTLHEIVFFDCLSKALESSIID